MTARARFTQAELARAIRAAEAAGKVAALTPQGILFVDRDEARKIVLPKTEESDVSPFDQWKAGESQPQGRQ